MFRTELTIAPQERLLPRTARVLTVGSCFADSIGERLRQNKVTTLANPFGTVFQPLALAQLLRAAAGEEQDWQQHVVEARGRWQSYDFHGTIGAESPVELLQLIQEKVQQVGDFVRTADAVVLTLGTAWVYRLRETGELVSNLHKLPASLFEKELLTADEIVNSLAEVHALLRRINPTIRIVLTVSPVRHIKDTLPLNAVSKSVLRVACHYLSELLPNVSYFPAYELLTDDLRDYRFYAADMLHPSDAAEDYIWERFARAYFDTDFGRFRKEWAAVRQSLGHRPLHAGAPEHRAFLDQTRERLERLAGQGVEVRQELREVQRQLAALPPPRPVRVPEIAPENDEERIDIGDIDTTDSPATESAVMPTMPRSDREHRSNNRRDDRRPNRANQAERRNQPTPAALPETAETLATDNQAEELVAAAAEAVLTHAEPALLVPEDAPGYPDKKKKRRSRGGAKRTARKNAARMAVEQETGLATLPDETASADGLETLAGSEHEGELLAEDLSFAEPILLEELPNEPVELAAEAELPGELAAELVEAADAASDNAEEVAEQPEPAAEQPAQPRKRGTGPTPKKSKVITKSGLLKRGKRTSLYRSPTPDPTAADESEPTAVPATAPIISPPIIPEILLERPAVELAAFPPSEPTVEEFAAEVAAAAAEAPAKPKRGRPKAARQTAPDNPAEAAPTAEVASDASESTPVTDEPTPAAENPSPAAAPAKKRAARTPSAKAPKKDKKEAAKPAAPRRGRPPGRKNPPTAPTEAPAS